MGLFLAFGLGLISIAACEHGGDETPRVSRFGQPEFLAYITDDDDDRVGLSAVGRRRTRIAIEIKDPPAERQLVEIRTGECPPIGPYGGPQYVLDDIVDGQSENIIPVPLRMLMQDGYVLFIYPGPAANNYSMMCVDLTEAEPAEE